jgi:hypothetical protein
MVRVPSGSTICASCSASLLDRSALAGDTARIMVVGCLRGKAGGRRERRVEAGRGERQARGPERLAGRPGTVLRVCNVWWAGGPGTRPGGVLGMGPVLSKLGGA